MEFQSAGMKVDSFLQLAKPAIAEPKVVQTMGDLPEVPVHLSESQRALLMVDCFFDPAKSSVADA
jgi:hypothetical protein